MFNLIKRIAITAAVFAALYGICSQFSYFQGFDVTIHGWAWALYLPLIAVSVFAQGFIGSFANGFLSGTAVEPSPVVAKFIDEFCDWPVMALAFLITAHFMPADASCTSSTVLMVLASCVGLASAISDNLCTRFAPRKPKSE